MNELYKPKGAVESEDYPACHWRIMLVGLGGTGKTISAIRDTPNPVVCDFDNALGGFRKMFPDKQFQAIPFWDRKFVTEVMKCRNSDHGQPENMKHPPNARDAFKYWLSEEAPQLTGNQTLVLDSWTSLQAAFDVQSLQEHEKSYSKKTGEEDTRDFWGRKKNYARDITVALKLLPCNVIVIAHETYERNDNGSIVGIKAVMDGSFADELPTQFTDVYRQRFFTKEEAATLNLKDSGYYWQAGKDQYFKFGKKSKPSLADYIPATWNSLL